jgi:magnesium-transporting ATPase (P-type)
VVGNARGGGASIAKLNQIGIAVKVITGDNGTVAAKVCRDIGVEVEALLTGRRARLARRRGKWAPPD